MREKNDGTMDRIYAAGVSSRSSKFYLGNMKNNTDSVPLFFAVIIGHYVISNVILMVQTAMLLILVVIRFIPHSLICIYVVPH